LILAIEPPQSVIEYRVSVRRCGRDGQFRKQLGMASQAPPIHSFDAIKPGGGIWLWEAAIAEHWQEDLEIGNR
jgi:hypothetical protein